MISTLKKIFEKSWEWDEDKFISFPDLEKAFDRAPRLKIWHALNDNYYEIRRKNEKSHI